ncbi:MAG: hypothetical protein FWG64_06425 [Firmicutes bacterium]|nr:hypothetical protein [Bacillota bacterium]
MRADNIRPYVWRFVGADITYPSDRRVRQFLYNSLFLSCSSINIYISTILALIKYRISRITLVIASEDVEISLNESTTCD